MNNTLVFDGYCGFCTRFVRWLQRIDQHQRLQVVAFQSRGFPAALRPMTGDRLEAALYVDKLGNVSHGAAALVAALSEVTNLKALKLMLRFAPLRWILNTGYAWVAARRHALRGVKSHCMEPGADCIPMQATCATS